MQNNKSSHARLIWILGFLTALSPFSIDMYLPAFPQIAADFQTSSAKISWSLSSYFIGLSLGQIFYGPLLDRFGRKPPLYFGLSLFILASIGCLFAHTIEVLIALRFLQALGGCAASVTTMASVRDYFSTQESAKVFSLLVLILGASPLLAPTTGSYLAASFGWHSIFIVLGGIAFILLLVSIFFLPAKHLPDASISLKPIPILKEFLSIFKNPQFFTYTVSGALAFAGLFVYVASSPIIFMDIFKVSSVNYGWIFGFLSIGFIGASQLNVFLVKKFRSEELMRFTLTAYATTAVLFAFGTAMQWYGLRSSIFFLFVILCTVGVANPNGAALALAPFSKNAGSASALMGFIQMGIGALISLLVGFISVESMLPITLVFAICGVLALIVFYAGKSKILHEVDVEEDGAIVVH